MVGPKAPPPGSIPSSMMSPDVTSMMKQMGQAQNTAGSNAGSTSMPPQMQNARALGTPAQEVGYAAKDITQGILSHLPQIFQDALHIKPEDSQMDIARKQKIRRELTQSYEAGRMDFIKKKAAEAEQKQRQEEEEKRQKQLAEQQRSQQSMNMPSGKKSGPAAAKQGQSKGDAFIDNMQQKRQQLSSAG